MNSDRIACADGEAGSKIDRFWAGFAPLASTNNSHMSIDSCYELLTNRVVMTAPEGAFCSVRKTRL